MDTRKIQKRLQHMADEREWNQFHTPKNLSMALNVEASELLEIFQWLTAEESAQIKNSPKLVRVKEELADILVYALRMADILNINLEEAILSKIEQNRQKYPADKARGNAKKYDEL